MSNPPLSINDYIKSQKLIKLANNKNCNSSINKPNVQAQKPNTILTSKPSTAPKFSFNSQQDHTQVQKFNGELDFSLPIRHNNELSQSLDKPIKTIKVSQANNKLNIFNKVMEQNKNN